MSRPERHPRASAVPQEAVPSTICGHASSSGAATISKTSAMTRPAIAQSGATMSATDAATAATKTASAPANASATRPGRRAARRQAALAGRLESVAFAIRECVAAVMPKAWPAHRKERGDHGGHENCGRRGQLGEVAVHDRHRVARHDREGDHRGEDHGDRHRNRVGQRGAATGRPARMTGAVRTCDEGRIGRPAPDPSPGRVGRMWSVGLIGHLQDTNSGRNAHTGGELPIAPYD